MKCATCGKSTQLRFDYCATCKKRWQEHRKNWRSSRHKVSICVDIMEKDIAQFLDQYGNKEYDKKTNNLAKKVMGRIVESYALIMELEKIHFTQKSHPLSLKK
jgi:hypothetical protein